MFELLTMDSEGVLRRWHELTKPRGPRRAFIKDGKLIAGEDIRQGELVYVSEFVHNSEESE